MEFLLDLLNKGVTPYHAVRVCIEKLKENGFEELSIKQDWNLLPGGKYYISPYASSLFAFVVGKKQPAGNIRMAMAHTDFPMLKVKSNPEMVTEGYCKLNVEPYGGMLKRTWFDRPLGLAGKVILKGADAFSPNVKLLDSEKAILILPSIAPHLQKESDAKEIDMQKEMLPVFAMLTDPFLQKDYFQKYIAEILEVNLEEILDYDLFLYNKDKGEIIGYQEEFISSPRIDNLASAAALVEGLIESDSQMGIRMISLFNHEEVGSRSKEGADSYLQKWMLEKIYAGLHEQKQSFHEMLANGFMLSVDGAHGLHPNYAEKSDPTNIVRLGDGVVLKSSATQRYVSDSEAAGVVIALCKEAKIPYQKQVNRSGMPGGQTLGPIASSYLPIYAADVGMPVLAMHSARELAHKKDYEALKNLVKKEME